jgi:hypothetical protein
MSNILSGLIPCCKIVEIDALLFQPFDHDKAFSKYIAESPMSRIKRAYRNLSL